MLKRNITCLTKIFNKKLDFSSVRKDSGQTLLIILLVAAVILTIGLAVASYSITNIKISQQEEESARVFSAAEAGIEEALRLGGLPADGTVTVGDVTATVTQQSQGEDTAFNFAGDKFEAGELANIWLIGHDTDGDLDPSVYFPANGTVTVCWGDNTDTSGDDTPALELALLYQDTGSFKIARGAYDPKDRGNAFDLADDTDGGNCGNLAFAKDISLGADLALPVGAVPYSLRLRLLYNSSAQSLAVLANSNLPLQGSCYESTASIPQSGVTRKVRQCQFFQSPPEIFDYVLFSGSNLSK